VSSLQELVEPWWVECEEHPVQRGQLVHAFVPHVGQTPYVLDAEGRSDPTSHDRALFKIRSLRVQDRRSRPQLPVAALPQNPGEVWTAHRAKVRPCLVISVGGPEVSRELRPQSSPKWQSAPTILVAPYYGAGRSGERAGWHQPFLDRMRACEYPQFLLDALPLGGAAESVLRLDHIQPIGRHHDSYTGAKFKLSKDALELTDQWLVWLSTGVLATDSILAYARAQLLEVSD
jgi:hypothetical protein